MSALALVPLGLAMKSGSRSAAAHTIPKPLEALEMPGTLGSISKADWLSFTDALPVDVKKGSTTTIPGDGSSGCTGGQSVTIFPMKASHLLVHKKGETMLDEHPDGFALAMIKNNTDCPTKIIPMPGQGYVFWIARKVGNLYKSDLVDDAEVSVVGDISFAYCVGHEKDHSSSEAYIKPKSDECKDGAKKKLHFESGDEIAIWMACSQTCCYADGLPQEKKKKK